MLIYPISVFIDTNIFDECKYHLEANSVLNSLRKFADSKKVCLYISNIVLGEAEKHIRDNVSSLYNLLEKQSKEMRKLISPSVLVGTPIEQYIQLPQNDGLEDAAFNKFRDYLSKTGFTVLDNSGVDANQLVYDYFHCKAPFENNEKKKSEFPDAIMISKLKGYFSAGNPVWIISSDKGFQRAFDGLNGYICLEKLKELFDIINQQDEKTTYDAIKLHLLNEDVLKDIVIEIEGKIFGGAFEIDGMDCDRKGICDGFEYDEAYIDSISDLSVKLCSVDDVSDDTVTVTIECRADISVLCSYDDYDNAAWDSDEKEYIFVERGEIIEYHTVDFESLLKFSVATLANEFNFRLVEIEFDLELDQRSRTNREFIINDNRSDAEAEMMDVEEDYHKH